MVRLGYVHPRPGWTAERDRLYKQTTASLDDFYFLMGQKRLGNLKLWAEGRGDRVIAALGKPYTALDAPCIIV